MAERVSDLIDAAADQAPPALAKYIKLLAPVVGAVLSVLEVVWPYYWEFLKLCVTTYHLLPKDAVTAIVGLVFCFCGGLYPMVFAAVQAAQLTGWDETVKAVSELVSQGKIIAAENKKDDDIDADNDGIADVKQVDAQALLLRKTKLVLTNCDPARINAALGGLYKSWLGVIAVLKVQFARTIALAMTISDLAKKPCDLVLLPSLCAIVPVEYRLWLPVLVGWMRQAIGMWIAFYVQRIISAFTSAVRGGLQTSRALLRIAVKQGLWSGSEEDTYADEVLGWALAAAGFYFQYTLGFAVPYPLNLVLWPFEMSESYIMWAVTSPSVGEAAATAPPTSHGWMRFGR